MLAGFWVELPLLCSFLLKSQVGKSKLPLDWQKMNEWSMKLVLPATLVGVAYGWNQPNREEIQLQKKIERIERRLDSGDSPTNASRKSWALAERRRGTMAEETETLSSPPR